MESDAQWPTTIFTKTLTERISSSRVLCVGAGGIGCELLKTLVCSGFQNIELIDLDTIETSNLNRQFLFRKHHVGQSKARIAAQVIKSIKPSAKIVAHHANVKEPQFDLDFFKQFDLVLNGLDNLEARRHVNRLCMAAERPLIESGTAGYVGQVSVHIKGRTECFECSPKPTPKTYPICTLRNTPDKPIHCIVWSKDLLFTRLLGRPDDVTDLDEGSSKPEGSSSVMSAEGQTALLGAEEVVKEDLSTFLRKEGEEPLAYAVRIFEKVYKEDMDRLIGMEELWKKRAPPKSLLLASLLPDIESELKGALKESKPGATACKILGLNNSNQRWEARDNARVFLCSLALFVSQRSAEVGSLIFDKDDDLAVELVISASNLRSICYDIPVQSLFDGKGMAGNIIHAIATTNAIISGLIVVEALKILSGSLPALRSTFLFEHKKAGNALIRGNMPEPPKPGCMSCGQAQLHLRLDMGTTTLSYLIEKIIKKRLAVCVPMLQCGEFFYEEGEGLEEDEVEMYQGLLGRPLNKLPGGGLHNGSILSVKDEFQHFNLELIISHVGDLEPEDAPEGFILEGAIPVAKSAGMEATAAASTTTKASGDSNLPANAARPPAAPAEDEDEDEDEDAVVIIVDETAASSSAAAASTRSNKEMDEGALPATSIMTPSSSVAVGSALKRSRDEQVEPVASADKGKLKKWKHLAGDNPDEAIDLS